MTARQIIWVTMSSAAASSAVPRHRSSASSRRALREDGLGEHRGRRRQQRAVAHRLQGARPRRAAATSASPGCAGEQPHERLVVRHAGARGCRARCRVALASRRSASARANSPCIACSDAMGLTIDATATGLAATTARNASQRRSASSTGVGPSTRGGRAPAEDREQLALVAGARARTPRPAPSRRRPRRPAPPSTPPARAATTRAAPGRGRRPAPARRARRRPRRARRPRCRWSDRSPGARTRARPRARGPQRGGRRGVDRLVEHLRGVGQPAGLEQRRAERRQQRRPRGRRRPAPAATARSSSPAAAAGSPRPSAARDGGLQPRIGRARASARSCVARAARARRPAGRPARGGGRRPRRRPRAGRSSQSRQRGVQLDARCLGTPA